MNAPQLSVRSAKARDLAHALSRRERRPIHAIVEEALIEYARRHDVETTADFLKRMRSIGGTDDAALDALGDALGAHRKPHGGIAL
jgi:hypothetical protein